MQKKYAVKIYSINGTYIKTLNPKKEMVDIRFTSRINGGQGQCILEVALPFDNFDEGVSIAHTNIVKIYEIDEVNSPTPRLIYTGFISQYAPYFRAGSEGVRIVLLGLVSLLSFGYFKNGSNFTVTKSATDPAQIMKDVIDHFNSIYSGSWIGYGAETVTVGTNVTYEFKDQKWFDSLKKAFDLAGSGRWWAIREDGQLWFKTKPVSPTHRFTLGQDVETGEIVKNNEQIVNALQLRWNTGLSSSTDYSDATSITAYGRREKIVSDERITLTGTADQRGNGEIGDNKNPKVQAKLRINTNYDIETIKPGDTCSVFNVKQGSTVFPSNMQITSVSYSPDGVDLELENTLATFGDNFEEAVNAISN